MRCDECGRKILKAYRNYKGHRYCGTCYAREFKRQICPKCGQLARLPLSDSKAICCQCEKNMPCVRCGKKEFHIGKITSYGPVCNSCLPYFQELKACGQCGRLSRRLTRVKRLGINVPVCPRCATQDHSTCPTCNKYRLLIQSSDGTKLCKACLEKAIIACPKCGQDMPAGLGKQCDKCYWKTLLKKRIKMDYAVFSVPSMANNFSDYGFWLGDRVGEHKAAITIHKYLVFFIEMEKQWGKIPSYVDLLSYFGSDNLRKVLLPVLWMEESGYIIVDECLKQENAEKRRIYSILNKFPKKSYQSQAIKGYYKHLMNKFDSDKTSLRSIRLTLSPAIALLSKANELETDIPNQFILDKYLEKSPGQQSALSGFINYLKKNYEADLRMPSVKSRLLKQRKMKKLEIKIKQLITDDNKINIKQRWIILALAYFHDLPLSIGRKIRDEHISIVSDDEIKVTWKGNVYWIPTL